MTVHFLPRSLAMIVLLAALAGSAKGMEKAQGWCESGGATVTTSSTGGVVAPYGPFSFTGTSSGAILPSVHKQGNNPFVVVLDSAGNNVSGSITINIASGVVTIGGTGTFSDTYTYTIYGGSGNPTGPPIPRSFMQSFPRCTVTVYITGSGGTKASLFSSNQPSPVALSNPFSADQFGRWGFYAANGDYDVQISGAGLPVPYTFGGIALLDPQRIASVRYADTFPGADPCIKIQNAILDLDQSSGVVDARAFSGTVTCSVNPFGSSGKAVTLLIGPATFTASAQWIVPNKSRLIGIGRGDPGGLNSVIRASGSFPSTTGVLSMCAPANGTPCFGVQIEHLTVDCASRPGCIGVYNAFAEEQSWVQHVLIQNNPGPGIFVDGAGQSPGFQPQNSGPYSDIEVSPGAAGVTGTNCIHVINAVVLRELSSITCNGVGYSSEPATAILYEGGTGAIRDVHIEHFLTGVQVGTPTNGAQDVIVQGIQAGPETTTAVMIPTSGAQTVQNTFISGVLATTTTANLLVDNCNIQTVSSNSGTTGLGLYATGLGVCGSQSIISTRNDVITIIQPGIQTPQGKVTVGLGNNFALGRHATSPVENFITTDAAGVIIQTNALTPGPAGGGLQVNGGGFGNDPAVGGMGAGYSGDLGTFTARAASAAGVIFADGIIQFLSNLGLTPGNTFTPTVHLKIGGANVIQVDGTAGFSGTKTAGSCTFTILYGIITNVGGC